MSTRSALRLVLVTPARNEVNYIGATIRSVAAQTRRPLRWVIVSDGSTDGTDDIVRAAVAEHDWIEFLRLPDHHDRTFAAKAICFNAGFERLKELDFNVVGNLDADITFAPDYLAFLLERFEALPRLGVAGTPFVEDGDHPGRHTYAHESANLEHVSGACQLFRRECFEAVGGYVPVKGGAIDWIAVTTARMKGWQTRTFVEKTSQHHRKIGTAESSVLKARFHYGRKAYYVGGYPPWELLRGVFQMRTPPYVLGGLWFIAGYLWAALTRMHRPVSRELMAFHRNEQRTRLKRLFDWHDVRPARGTLTTMRRSYGEISWRGRTLRVPAREVDGALVVVSGRGVRTAAVRDEEWLDEVPVRHAARFADQLRATGLRADVLSFGTGPAFVETNVSVPGAIVEADNVAVIDTSDFKAWWEGLPQEARKNTRRAAKRGVVVAEAVFDDRLIRGIQAIYDEAPIRQGRLFWHYGKDLETVRRENGTYLDRSTFLVAQFGDEIIGFMKWVRVGKAARIMQILCLNAHQDKRPIIALIAKAAEVCHAQCLQYLVYGKYTYGNKGDSSITEFKRRLGFAQLDYSRHHVPLSAWGRVALRLGLHRGLVGLIPAPVLQRLLQWRAAWYQRKARGAGAGTAAAASADE